MRQSLCYWNWNREVCTVRIGLIHVISSIYFCYIRRSIIYIFLFLILQVQLMDVSMCALRCNTAYLIFEVSPRSDKQLSDQPFSISRRFYIVNTIRIKWYCKCHMTLLYSSPLLHRSYSFLYTSTHASIISSKY